MKFGNYKTQKIHSICLPFFEKSPFGKNFCWKKPVFGGYLTFLKKITASFGHLKKIGIKELLGSDFGGKKYSKDPPVLGQINIKEPPVLLFQKRTSKELVVLGGALAFF